MAAGFTFCRGLVRALMQRSARHFIERALGGALAPLHRFKDVCAACCCLALLFGHVVSARACVFFVVGPLRHQRMSPKAMSRCRGVRVSHGVATDVLPAKFRWCGCLCRAQWGFVNWWVPPVCVRYKHEMPPVLRHTYVRGLSAVEHGERSIGSACDVVLIAELD